MSDDGQINFFDYLDRRVEDDSDEERTDVDGETLSTSEPEDDGDRFLTLSDARQAWLDFLHANAGKKGQPCPCCDRHAQIYRHRINQNRARGLFWLIRQSVDGNGGRAWVDVAETAPRWIVKSNQLSQLKHWKLVERMPNTYDTKRKHVGIWRPTEKGIDFARGRVSIPRHIYTLFDRLLRFEGPDVLITDAVGVDFNYSAMMRGEW